MFTSIFHVLQVDEISKNPQNTRKRINRWVLEVDLQQKILQSKNTRRRKVQKSKKLPLLNRMISIKNPSWIIFPLESSQLLNPPSLRSIFRFQRLITMSKIDINMLCITKPTYSVHLRPQRLSPSRNRCVERRISIPCIQKA